MLRHSGQVRSAISPAAKRSVSALKKRESALEPEVEDMPQDLAVVEEPIAEQAKQAETTCPAPEVYEQLVHIAVRILHAARVGEAPDEGAIIQILRQTIARLGEGEALLAEAMRHRDEAGDPAHRMVYTAVLCMRLGLEMGYDERRSLAVGLCALTHDLGMSKLPSEMMEKPKLDAKEIELLRQHPLESQRIVEAFGPAFAWIGKIVVQVHERRDGSGYPQGLRGDQIHEIARIIGLVDTYLGMAQPRADRPALVTYNALKEIIDLRRSRFDSRLIKVLINVVSIFPLGSLVKLNNGEIGRVIGTSRLHPTRPQVEVLLGPRGKVQEPPRHVNLEDEPMLYIVDPAIGEAVLKKK